MKEILNERFVKEGMYVNPLTIDNGLIVARTFSPRGYLNKKGEDESAWLPDIIICEANKNAPVKATGRGIIAKSPAKSYGLQFNPSWNEKERKGKQIIYTFEKAFIPEEKDEIGDILVQMYNSTKLYDSYIPSGMIIYSGIDNRNITLHGQINDLENMIIITSTNLPKRSYALEFSAPCCANSDKKYTIQISNEDLNKFAKIAVKKLF
jgi:hypothetical protein